MAEMAPTTPSSGTVHDGSAKGGFGWLASFGLATGLLFCANLAATHIHGAWARYAFCTAVFVVVVGVRPLRRVLVKAVILALIISASIYAARNHEDLMAGRVGGSDAARGIIREVGKLGPGKQLRMLFAQRSDAKRSIPYDRYVQAVDPRSPEVNDVASQLTRGCGNGDHLCESARLVRFVTDEVDYRSDPRGSGDYVKPPMQTYESRAGDCEDKTILLVSLLESVGIRTLVAFPPAHVYPMVCYARPLPKMLLTSVTIAKREGLDLRGYLAAMLPPGEGAAVLDRIASATHLRDRDRFCYAIETTERGSWIGTSHESMTVERVFDPIDRRVVELTE